MTFEFLPSLTTEQNLNNNVESEFQIEEESDDGASSSGKSEI